MKMKFFWLKKLNFMGILILILGSCQKESGIISEPVQELANLHLQEVKIRKAIEDYRQVTLSKDIYRQRFMSAVYASTLRAVPSVVDPYVKEQCDSFISQYDVATPELFSSLGFVENDIKEMVGKSGNQNLTALDRVSVAVALMLLDFEKSDKLRYLITEDDPRDYRGPYISLHEIVMNCVDRTLSITVSAAAVGTALGFVGHKWNLQVVKRAVTTLLSLLGRKALKSMLGGLGLAWVVGEIVFCSHEQYYMEIRKQGGIPGTPGYMYNQ